MVILGKIRAVIKKVGNIIYRTKKEVLNDYCINRFQGEDKAQLFYAVSKGKDRVVQELLKKGVEPNFSDKTGATPLSLAVNYKYFNIADMLIEHGALIDYSSDNWLTSYTALSFACHCENIDGVAYLIKKGADLNLSSKLCGTPLTAAIESNNVYIVKELLEAGADPNRKKISSGYQTEKNAPISIAAIASRKEIVDILVAHNAKTKPLRKIPRHEIPISMVRYLKTKKYL